MLSSSIPIVARPARCGLRAPKNLPARLLMVDDDACILRFNARALMRAGYEVDTAEDGTVAWNALHAREYDLMITDHSMPNLTGLELLKRLRVINLALPVIMASSTPPIEEFDRHPVLKPAALLCKPYLPDVLVQMVRQVLAQAQKLGSWGGQPANLEEIRRPARS